MSDDRKNCQHEYAKVVEFSKPELIPRSHQSLNMFKICLIHRFNNDMQLNFWRRNQFSPWKYPIHCKKEWHRIITEDPLRKPHKFSLAYSLCKITMLCWTEQLGTMHCGNYKFILCMLGLNGATANYACAWCKIQKDDRWKTDQYFSYFNSKPLSRSL